MGFQVEWGADLPVIVARWGEEFSYEHDFPAQREQVRRLLDRSDQPVYYVLDFRDYVLKVQELIPCLNAATREPQSNFHHPNVERIVFFTQSAVIKKVAQGVNSRMYGSLDVLVVHSIEEAYANIQKGVRMG